MHWARVGRLIGRCAPRPLPWLTSTHRLLRGDGSYNHFGDAGAAALAGAVQGLGGLRWLILGRASPAPPPRLPCASAGALVSLSPFALGDSPPFVLCAACMLRAACFRRRSYPRRRRRCFCHRGGSRAAPLRLTGARGDQGVGGSLTGVGGAATTRSATRAPWPWPGRCGRGRGCSRFTSSEAPPWAPGPDGPDGPDGPWCCLGGKGGGGGLMGAGCGKQSAGPQGQHFRRLGRALWTSASRARAAADAAPHTA